MPLFIRAKMDVLPAVPKAYKFHGKIQTLRDVPKVSDYLSGAIWLIRLDCDVDGIQRLPEYGRCV